MENELVSPDTVVEAEVGIEAATKEPGSFRTRLLLHPCLRWLLIMVVSFSSVGVGSSYWGTILHKV